MFLIQLFLSNLCKDYLVTIVFSYLVSRWDTLIFGEKSNVSLITIKTDRQVQYKFFTVGPFLILVGPEHRSSPDPIQERDRSQGA